MAEIRGLGQARRARGVDVEGVVLADEPVAHRLVGYGRRALRERGVEILGPRRGAAGEPGDGFGLAGRHRLLPGLRKLVAYDRLARLGDGDAMRERGPAQVGVDEGHDRAELHQPQPRHQVFGTAFHEQRDGVALADVLRKRPMRIAVRARGQLRVGQRAVLVEHGDVGRFVAREILDDVADGARRLRAGVAQAPKRARDRADIDGLARNPIHHAHRRFAPALDRE